MFATEKTDHASQQIFPTLIDSHADNQLMDEELSYLAYFGLRSNPFPVAPDDENFYFSEYIDQVVTELVHGIVTRKGFMVLTGDIGLGKTTISRWILNILEKKKIETSLVFHTTFQDVELLAEINRDFGITADGTTFSDHMWALNQFLLEQNRNGRNCAIIIDDAQNLSRKSLELIRMISNLEAYHEKLVQILLVGQPELMDSLNTKELRQLKSRIIINKEVRPLDSQEIKNYLQFKLSSAGNKGLLRFDAKAFRQLYHFTKGNFRQLNTLMDRCLYAAFLDGTKEIGGRIVKAAHADLNPPPRRKKMARSIGGMAAVILGLAALAIGLYAFGPMLNRHNAQLTSQMAAGESAVRPHGTASAIPSAPIKKFLAAYALTPYAQKFAQALKTQQLTEVASTIYADTGYHLIRLTKLPEGLRQEYDVLAYPSQPASAVAYYFFWKPIVHFPQFYYRLEGRHVLMLQEMLAGLNLYNDTLDGIAGKHLMQAIIQFQKQAGLTVTGYPDPTTIFLIAHAAKRNTS